MAKLSSLFGKLLGKADDVADVAKYADDVTDFGRLAQTTKSGFDDFLNTGRKADVDFLNARDSFNNAMSDFENVFKKQGYVDPGFSHTPASGFNDVGFDYTPNGVNVDPDFDANSFLNKWSDTPRQETKSFDDIMSDFREEQDRLKKLFKDINDKSW